VRGPVQQLAQKWPAEWFHETAYKSRFIIGRSSDTARRAGALMSGLSFEEAAVWDCYPQESGRLRGRWYFRLNATGQVLETDVIVVRSEDWMGRNEARDASWRPMDFGVLTVAVKIVC
jgi:hypothetical protein